MLKKVMAILNTTFKSEVTDLQLSL